MGAALLLLLLPGAEAHHLRYDLTGANSFNGTGAWKNDDGVTGLTTGADANDDLYAKTVLSGDAFQMVLSDPDASLAGGTVNAVEAQVRIRVSPFVDDGFTLSLHVGNTLVAGPVDVAGASAETLRTWDATLLRAWTVADLNQLQLRVAARSVGAADGTWMVDQALVRVGINRAPTVTGASMTTLEDNAFSSTLTASDPDAGDAVTLAIVTNGAKGSAVITDQANRAYTYTPNANEHGADSFTFRATDAGGLASPLGTVSVSITPVNDRPGFTKGPDQTVLEDGGARSIGNWARDITAGPNEAGQSLTFQVSNNDNSLFVSQPSIDNTGRLTFSSAPNRFGSALVSVTLRDNGGRANGGEDTSALQTFTITVTNVNDPPSFTGGADVAVLEDAGAQTVAGWATNLNPGPFEAGQVLTFLATPVNAAQFSSGPSVDAATGTLAFRTAPDVNGNLLVDVRLRDDGGTLNGGIDTSAAHRLTITVSPVNDAPRGVADAYLADEDVTLVVPAPGVLGNDVDLEGDTKTATLDQDAQHGSVSLNPDGSFSYTPDPEYVGPDSFRYHPSDPLLDGATVTVSLTVRFVNDPPVAVGGTHRAKEGATTFGSLFPFFTDDSTSFTFAITDDGQFGTATLLNPATGSFSYAAPANMIGADRILFTVSDGQYTSLPGRVDVFVAREVFAQEDRVLQGSLRSSFDGAGALRYEITKAPRHGLVFLHDAANGLYTYVPDSNVARSDEFEFRVLSGSTLRNAGALIVTVNQDTIDLSFGDNDQDGFSNLLEWSVGSDAERAHSTPANVRNLLVNPGFEAGLAGWQVLRSGPVPALENINYFDPILGGLDSGAALRLVNGQGAAGLRAVQSFDPPNAAAGTLTGGDYLLVDLLGSTGAAYASACYDAADCSNGKGAHRVPLEVGTNRIRLANTGNARLLHVTLWAPEQAGGSATFDNVRIEGLRAAGSEPPVLPLRNPAFNPHLAQLSFQNPAGAGAPLGVTARVVDSAGANVPGYSCRVYDEERRELPGGLFPVGPSTPRLLHFKAVCHLSANPATLALGEANHRLP